MFYDQSCVFISQVCLTLTPERLGRIPKWFVLLYPPPGVNICVIEGIVVY